MPAKKKYRYLFSASSAELLSRLRMIYKRYLAKHMYISQVYKIHMPYGESYNVVQQSVKKHIVLSKMR